MLKIFFRQNFLAVVGLCAILINSSLQCSLEIPILDNWECVRPLPKRLSIKHTEGKGLGYSQGYTSFDLFGAQPFCDSQLIPFADIRGHVFNHGRFAWNAGLGLRWTDPSYTQGWGINFFYDSFRNSRLQYRQLGIGLEAIGDTWEARVNGYLPIGRKKTPIYFLSYDFSSGFLAKAREQFAMGGIDAELGYHFCGFAYFDLRASLGPYFYWGRSRKTENAFRATHKEVIGGRLRACAILFNYFELEGIATYDSRFKWGGQVTLAINIPFDWTCSHQETYCAPWRLQEGLFRPVSRNEIIVIDRINRFSSNPEILNPEFKP